MPPNSIQSLCLQPETKQLLISCVRERRAIWGQSCVQYSDNGARRRAYSEVAQALSDHTGLHYKPQEVQIEWKKMRDVFNRTLKKVMSNSGSIAWRYFNEIKFIASPEQLAFLRQREDESSDNTADPYGIQQFLENSTRNGLDENLSLFNKDNDESTDLKTIDLGWITARCAEQKNENTSTKSSYDDPPTTTQTDADSAEVDEEETNVVPRKRRHIQPKPSSSNKEPRAMFNDTYDAFGLFVASQLRSLSKRNRVAGANLQRAILEICLKSELEN